jgi:hypothetical protein
MLGGNAETSRSTLVAVLVAIVVLTCIAYLPGLDGQFVVDDRPLIVENEGMSLASGALRFFGEGMWSFSALEREDRSLYRPLFLVALAAQRDLFGINPLPFHGVSLVLHILNTCLLFMLLRRIPPLSDPLPSIFATALFALHPIHVEAVSWISAQSHLFATCFVLLACHAHPSLQRSRWRTAGVGFGALLLAAFLCQEIALAVLAPVALHLGLRRDRRTGMAALAALVAATIYFAMRSGALGVTVPLQVHSPSQWWTSFEFAVQGIRGLVVPWPQCFYVEAPAAGMATGLSYLAFAVALVFTVLAVVSRGPLRGVVFPALTCFGAGWLLSLSGAFNLPPRFAPRSLYLPSAALSIFVAAVLARHGARVASSAGRLVGGTLLAALLVLTFLQTAMWDSDDSVFERAVTCFPEATAHQENHGESLERRGDLVQAETSYRRAAGTAVGEPKVVNLENLARVLAGQGKLDAAEETLETAVGLAPERSSLWVGLGNVAFARGGLERAQEHYRRAVGLDDTNYEAVYNLALTLSRLGRVEEAQALEPRLDELGRRTGPS